MSQNWIRSITMYLIKAECQMIVSKVELLEVARSSFTKQAVKTYIKHLKKHLEDAEFITAQGLQALFRVAFS